MMNFGNKIAQNAAKAFVPIVFGVTAEVVAGVAAYAAKHIEFPDNSVFEKQGSRIRNFFAGTPYTLKKEKEIFQKRINAAKCNFESYVSMHEEILKKDIQQPINEINKNKSVIKELVFRDLADALKKMRIQSEFKDYPLEVLDYREFPILDEYEIIKKEQKALEKAGKEINDFFMVLAPHIALFQYMHDLKVLHGQSEDFKEKAKFSVTRMESDLERMDVLSAALKNISEIFTHLKNMYVPFIIEFAESIINDFLPYDKIPKDQLVFIINCSRVLKEICEKRIINSESLDSVLEYNDELSIKYCELKTLCGIAA